MTAPFASPQEAARALIASSFPLTRRSGQFVGGIIYDPTPPTEKQLKWLVDLLDRAGLPTLANGGE